MQHVRQILERRRISGSHAISLLDLEGRAILLVGEIHENPGPCTGTEASADVLDDVVLPLWRDHQALVLVEGFVRQYHVGGSGHLSRLRRLAWDRPRFLFFDVRHALGMASPFDAAFDAADVRRNLAGVRRLHEYVAPSRDPRWRRRLRTFLDLVAHVSARPSVEGYHQIFMAVPDLVALSLILGKRRHRTVVVYAGDRHRAQLERWLVDDFGGRVVARSLDVEGGSCSRPEGQKSSAASRVWRWMRRMP